MPCACAAVTIARRTPRSTAASADPRCSDPEAAAEVPHREVAELGQRGRRAANGSRSSSCEPMWACSPSQRQPRDRRARARSPRAPAAIEKPNFESAWPVEIFSWVSPCTSGVTRTSTGWRAARPRARPRRSAPRARSISSKLSITIAPRRCRSAMPQLRLGLGVAVQHDPLRAKAGAQRQVQLAAGGDVAPQALLANSSSTAVQGNALEANTTWKSLVAGSRARPAGRRGRARAGRPRRPRRRACRTRAASSIVSQPPTSRRPRSLRRLPRGNTSERVVPVAIAADYRLPLQPPSDGGRRAMRRRGALRPSRRRASAARPPRRTITTSQTEPITISTALSSCGAVSPTSTSLLRRMNSTRNRSRPLQQRGRARRSHPGARGRAAATARRPAGTC